MRRTKRTVLLVLIIVFTLLSLFNIAAAEIKFGILPRLSAAEMTAMFSPLAEYLSNELQEKVTLVIPPDYEAFKTMLSKGEFQIALSNPIIYIQLRKTQELAPLALMAEAKGGTRFRGIIITHRDSGIEKIQDLKGKKLIFVDKNAAGGYIFQMSLLSKAGFNVKKDFITLPFAKKQDKVAVAVFNRSADAGGIREDDFGKMGDDVDLKQLKIVAFTDYYPNHTVVASPGLDGAKVEKIKTALFHLMLTDQKAEKVLNAAKIVGFGKVSDRDFDKLREAVKLTGAY
jgi:phosphonate transport system substrate-binding protein